MILKPTLGASVISTNPSILNPLASHLLTPIHPTISTGAATVASKGDTKYGLSGLVPLASSQAGFDLTTLGLNLNAVHPIWRTLVSPFAVDEASQLKVARHEFSTPASFVGFEFRPTPEQMRTLPTDALFFAFLAAPQDAVQEAAAEEFRLRGWTWSTQAGKWTSREGQVLEVAEWTKAFSA